MTTNAFLTALHRYNSLGSNICDLPIYVVLLTGYLEPLVSRQLSYDMSAMDTFLVKLACLVFVTILNLRGVQSVTIVSFVLTVLLLSPFVVQPFLPDVHLKPDTWFKSASVIDWSAFMSTLLWNYQGWDGLGCIAGEVKNGKRTYPLGIILALLMMTITYSIPIAVGVSMDSDFDRWGDGYLSTIANEISPWMGVWVVVGAMIANLGNFNVMMCTSSHALWAMAKSGMMFKPVGKAWDRFGTPAAAIVTQALVTLVLMNFGFNVLVLLDTFFNNISLFLETMSFVMLRYREPNTHRPYKVPGGLYGAWLVAFCKSLVIGFALVTADPLAFYIVGGVNVFAALAFFATRRYQQHKYPDKIQEPIFYNWKSVDEAASGRSTPGGANNSTELESTQLLGTCTTTAASAPGLAGSGGEQTDDWHHNITIAAPEGSRDRSVSGSDPDAVMLGWATGSLRSQHLAAAVSTPLSDLSSDELSNDGSGTLSRATPPHYGATSVVPV